MINILFPKLHREGYRFLILAAILTFILFLFSNLLGFLGFILTVWVFYFFRDPERISINDQNYLVSPADGVISKIVKINGPEELGMDKKEFIRISIFMNVFDCHVNRVPSSGNVVDIFYKPGSFFNASLDKASEKNERNLIKFKTNNGEEIAIVQIAGLIARRIVCDCHKDQKLEQGERFGIIRFGSRVDVYLENFNVLVKENQKTY